MDLGSLLLILTVTLLTALYVVQPLMQTGEAQKGRRRLFVAKDVDVLTLQQSALMAERERALQSLRELEADHDLGKIEAEDYAAQRADLLKTGAAILQQLDAIKAQKINARSAETTGAPAAAENADKPLTVVEVDELELLIADRRRGRQEKAAGFCAQCGAPLQKSDRFCPRCGKPSGAPLE